MESLNLPKYYDNKAYDAYLSKTYRSYDPTFQLNFISQKMGHNWFTENDVTYPIIDVNSYWKIQLHIQQLWQLDINVSLSLSLSLSSLFKYDFHCKVSYMYVTKSYNTYTSLLFHMSYELETSKYDKKLIQTLFTGNHRQILLSNSSDSIIFWHDITFYVILFLLPWIEQPRKNIRFNIENKCWNCLTRICLKLIFLITDTFVLLQKYFSKYFICNHEPRMMLWNIQSLR